MSDKCIKTICGQFVKTKRLLISVLLLFIFIISQFSAVSSLIHPISRIYSSFSASSTSPPPSSRIFSNQRCMYTDVVQGKKMEDSLRHIHDLDYISYLSQAQSVAIDEELMGSIGFSIDQLMVSPEILPFVHDILWKM